MKKSYKFLLTVEIISILILGLLIYLSANIYHIIGFTLVKLLILIKYFGLEKKNDRFKRENITNILLIILSYYFITYLLGIFIGFVQSSYLIDIVHIIKNAFPIFIFILFSELLRFEYTTKAKDCKLILYLSVIFFVALDIAVVINGYDFKNLETIVKFIASVVFPVIAKNLMLTYQSCHSSYRDAILYRCLMELPIYMLPIVPDLGLYVNSSIKVIIPALVFYETYELYRGKEKKEKIKRSKAYDIFFSIVIVFLIIIIALTSGLFKYYALAVGSGSMTPVIHKGDVVIVKKLDVEGIKHIEVGEVLVYNKDGKTIVHRVVHINKITENKYYFYTKGDNNNSNDGYPIAIENIIGVAKGRIRFIGYPTVLLNEIFESR